MNSIEEKIAENYNNNYEAYHKLLENPKLSPFNHFVAFTTMFEEASPYIENKDVVDLGCGNGYFTSQLEELGPRSIYGIDTSKVAIDNARSLYSDIIFDVGDMGKTPYADGQFETVIMNLSLNYKQDLPEFFKEVRRITSDKDDVNVFMIFSHTFFDSFNYDSNTKIATQKQDYFHLPGEKDTWQMPGENGEGIFSERMPYFRHSIKDISTALYLNDFLIAEISEPRPHEDMKEDNPKAYELASNIPIFTFVHAEKM